MECAQLCLSLSPCHSCFPGRYCRYDEGLEFMRGLPRQQAAQALQKYGKVSSPAPHPHGQGAEGAVQGVPFAAHVLKQLLELGGVCRSSCASNCPCCCFPCLLTLHYKNKCHYAKTVRAVVCRSRRRVGRLVHLVVF